MDIEPRQLLSYFESRRDVITESIRDLVDIESPSCDAQASRAVADQIETNVHRSLADASVERISVDHGDHLVIRAFAGDGPTTMLLGHTDTVHPVGSRDRNRTRIEGDRFYGCGIFDMKSNVVMMLEALNALVSRGMTPRGPVTIVLSCDEEIGSFTGRAIVEREAAAAARCLVFEPSLGGRIKTGRKGTGIFTLRVHGRPSHAGLEPELGINAVSEIARQIEPIHKLGSVDEGTTVNVTMIRGGTASNVIPELAECDIDVRFKTVAEAARVDMALRSLQAIEPEARLELVGGINRPPLERTDRVGAFYDEARRIGDSFGYEIGEAQVGGASDANFVAALGIPVLDGLGIAGAGAHMLTEHILLSDVARRCTLVTMLL